VAEGCSTKGGRRPRWGISPANAERLGGGKKTEPMGRERQTGRKKKPFQKGFYSGETKNYQNSSKTTFFFEQRKKKSAGRGGNFVRKKKFHGPNHPWGGGFVLGHTKAKTN